MKCILKCDIQMKTIEQHLPVVVVFFLESVRSIFHSLLR